MTHGEGGAKPGNHISNKTLYIALNYQSRADDINRGVVDEVAEQLVKLETEQERLEYYVSLLKEKQEKVIRLFYFDGMAYEKWLMN